MTNVRKTMTYFLFSAVIALGLLRATLAQGSLTGTGLGQPPASVDLTADGTSDWAHYSGTFAHKATGGGQLSNFTETGQYYEGEYNDNYTGFSWSDGTPTTSASSLTTGYYIGSGNINFTITAPASTASRTLKVYVGGFDSGGTLTAHLSDGSAPDYVDSAYSNATGPDGDHYYAVYTLVYKSAAASATLSVTWAQTSGTGNITLQAASLAGPAPVNPTAPKNLTATAFTQSALLNWSVVAPARSFNIKRSETSGGPYTTIASNFPNLSYVDTNLTAGKTYYYVVSNVVSGSETANSNQISVVPASTAIVASRRPTDDAINLTAEGRSDWTTYAVTPTTVSNGDYDSTNRESKVTGSHQISYLTLTGTAYDRLVFGNGAFSWTDGTLIPTANNAGGTVYSIGLTAGRPGQDIVLPADTNVRVARFYVFGYNSQGTFTAHLSDGSSPDYTETFGIPTYYTTDSTHYDAVYTISYRAASAGQKLTVSWNNAQGDGIGISAVTLVGPAPTVSVVNAATVPATVDLTAEGTLDWAHWGEGSPDAFDHKAGANLLSNRTVIDPNNYNLFTDYAAAFAWSDGTPTPSASGITSGDFALNQNNGFTFTAPADTTLKTLSLYVGGYGSRGQLTAHLSDNSWVDYVDSSHDFNLGPDFAHYYALYRISYKAASAGQTLSLEWKQISNNGNVTLAAASLGTGPAVTGNIALEGVNSLTAISAGAPLGTFHIAFRTPGTTTQVYSQDVPLTKTTGSPNGRYSVSGVPAGTYDVNIKGPKNLSVTIPGVVVSASGASVADVLLGAGDSDGNNVVDTTDFNNLVGVYGNSYDPNQPNTVTGYDPTVDFDFNGVIDTGDFNLLVGEFGNSGS